MTFPNVADIFEWKPARGVKFDTLYWDIWPTICVSNLKDMAKLGFASSSLCANVILPKRSRSILSGRSLKI